MIIQTRTAATIQVAATLLIGFGLCAACHRPVETAEDLSRPAKLSVLFVGNSLTAANDLPGIVAALIDSSGAGPARVDTVALSGFGLEDHWFNGPARRTIASGGWDIVVLQQGPSATEGRPSLLEYSERFAVEARTAGAEVALLMVWPSVARFDNFDGVSASYRMAAENVRGLLFPAGDAWRAAWAADPELSLYGPDGFHPAPAGSYLAALVVAAELSGRSPLGLPGGIRTASGVRITLDPETAAVLRSAAAEALENRASPGGSSPER